MHKDIVNHVHKNYPNFEVHNTEVSVNTILKKNNKAEGIKHLCKKLNLSTGEVAYVGDTGGDVEALKLVGKSYAPINADSYVKEIAGLVTAEATLGVLEAYEDVISSNRNQKG